MANVVFHDYRVEVKNALNDSVLAYLYEAAGELEARTIRNTRQGKKYRGKQATSLWKHSVDEAEQTAMVGSPDEAAYWEEFGTGEYALHGDGRKGWWVYVEGNDTPRSGQPQYTKNEALAMAASMRTNGLDAHATNGIEPNRPLHKAFTAAKSKLLRMAEQVIGGGMK